MIKKFNATIEKLECESVQRTGSAIVSMYVKDISALKQNGVTLKIIHKEFENSGLRLSYKGFSKALKKAKRFAKTELEPINQQSQNINKPEDNSGNDGSRDSVADLDRLAEEMFKKTERKNFNIFK